MGALVEDAVDDLRVGGGDGDAVFDADLREVGAAVAGELQDLVGRDGAAQRQQRHAADVAQVHLAAVGETADHVAGVSGGHAVPPRGDLGVDLAEVRVATQRPRPAGSAGRHARQRADVAEVLARRESRRQRRAMAAHWGGFGFEFRLRL